MGGPSRAVLIAIALVLSSCTGGHARSADSSVATTADLACYEAHRPQLVVDGRPGPDPQDWAGRGCPPNEAAIDSCAVFSDSLICRWPALPTLTGRHDVSVTAGGDPVTVTISGARGQSTPVAPADLPNPAPGQCWRVDVTATGRDPARYYARPPYLQAYFVWRGGEAADCDWLR